MNEKDIIKKIEKLFEEGYKVEVTNSIIFVSLRLGDIKVSSNKLSLEEYYFLYFKRKSINIDQKIKKIVFNYLFDTNESEEKLIKDKKDNENLEAFNKYIKED